MTRQPSTLVEGVCWFAVGLFLMCIIAKLAFDYR
jgi:hypothetical protein